MACTAAVTGGGCPSRTSSVSCPETQVSRVTSVPCSASRIAFSLSTSTRALSSADARQILARAGVDLQDVALIDEERHLQAVAGLQRRRLHRSGDRVAAGAGIALHHLQLDGVGQVDGDGASVPEEHRGVQVLLEEVPRLAEPGGVDVALFVVLRIHEDVVVALLVEVMHLLFLDVGASYLLAGLEVLLQGAAGDQALVAGAHERRALAGFDVLELDDHERLVVDQDLESVAELAGVDHIGHRCGLPCPESEGARVYRKPEASSR